jgi:RNA polymerase primary sigma factor
MRALKIEHSITRRDEKSLERYFSEISKLAVLTPDQEVALFKRIAEGDEAALDKIVRHNLRFVVSVAKQYQHIGLKLGDLINEGNIGLIKAARRFDVTRGFKFISYGVWWIRQSILQAINEKGRKIRMPSNQQAANKKIRQARMTFLQVEERSPSVEELADLTEMTAEKVQQNLSYDQPCTSIDASIKEGEDTPMSSLMADENVADPDFNLAVRESQQKQVEVLLNKLPEKEARVLSLYYGIGQQPAKSLQDIAENYELTRERVRQIKDRALRRLRHRSRGVVPVFG